MDDGADGTIGIMMDKIVVEATIQPTTFDIAILLHQHMDERHVDDQIQLHHLHIMAIVSLRQLCGLCLVIVVECNSLH